MLTVEKIGIAAGCLGIVWTQRQCLPESEIRFARHALLIGGTCSVVHPPDVKVGDVPPFLGKYPAGIIVLNKLRVAGKSSEIVLQKNFPGKIHDSLNGSIIV